MSYRAYEDSVQSGAPIELYQFAAGAEHWRYTSGDQVITFQSQDYLPLPIHRSEIDQGQDVARSSLKVTMPGDALLPLAYRAGPPEQVVSLTLFRHHSGDTEWIVAFKGRLTGLSWRGSEAELTAEPIWTSVRRPGLRRMYQHACPHVVYGQGDYLCNANPAAFQVPAVLTAVASDVISAAEFGAKADGWFTGGEVVWNGARRLIMAHVGNDMTVSRPFSGLAAGDQVVAYAGCDHRRSTCLSKFNNISNFGGFPWIPKRNPFGGGEVI